MSPMQTGPLNVECSSMQKVNTCGRECMPKKSWNQSFLWSLKRSLSRQPNLGASSSRYYISYALLDVAKHQSFLKAFDETITGCPILPLRPAKGIVGEVVLYGLYPLIWGEVANTRFVPKCLCYIFHNLVYELHGLLAGNISILTGENIKPSYGVDDEAFLRNVAL
ncbi:hypothetical protein VNO77_03332 [Canavalia gladiata]|uniref:1,3-beta-glucan synthase component FKS1-like domain-containing protein n=1 Tax=Canavalia gladiata TaxID=3824 RepID=A0AAN9MZN9_CANGL